MFFCLKSAAGLSFLLPFLFFGSPGCHPSLPAQVPQHASVPTDKKQRDTYLGTNFSKDGRAGKGASNTQALGRNLMRVFPTEIN